MEIELKLLGQKFKQNICEFIYNGNLTIAEKMIQEYSHYNLPIDCEIYNITAKINILKCNYDLAEINLKKALIIDIFDFNILYNLIYVLIKLDKISEAYCYYKFTKNSIQSENELMELDLLTSNVFKDTKLFDKKPVLKSFLDSILEGIKSNCNNLYLDNIDKERFENFNGFGIDTKNQKNDILRLLDGISDFYEHLEDNASKQTLLNVILYRVLGHEKFKINNTKFLRECEKEDMKKNILSNNKQILKYLNWDLQLYDLKNLEYDIKLYNAFVGVYNIFILKQYEYKTNNCFISVNKGDYVIDAGGCLGDTSLFFAHNVGENGKVFSFEFVPKNLEIMKKNILMNEKYKSIIEVVEKAIFDKSDEIIRFTDNGPGSSIADKWEENLIDVQTITLDDFVERNRISKIDFIKMDIEGSELKALKGAEKIIRKYKPRLAISIYHKNSDLQNIFKFINSLNMGYKFYLDHYTIHLEETVLYAK